MNAPKRLLGVDYGTVRVGLAFTDPDHKFSFPLDTRERKSESEDAIWFRNLIQREEIAVIIVGLPMHTDGREGVKAIEARKYGTWLAEVTGCRVLYHDERFTTVDAESHLWNAGLTHKKRKERRDRVAAQIMLESFLESGCPGLIEEPPTEEVPPD